MCLSSLPLPSQEGHTEQTEFPLCQLCTRVGPDLFDFPLSVQVKSMCKSLPPWHAWSLLWVGLPVVLTEITLWLTAVKRALQIPLPWYKRARQHTPAETFVLIMRKEKTVAHNHTNHRIWDFHISLQTQLLWQRAVLSNYSWTANLCLWSAIPIVKKILRKIKKKKKGKGKKKKKKNKEEGKKEGMREREKRKRKGKRTGKKRKRKGKGEREREEERGLFFSFRLVEH